jgi:FAD/FMN-containing dehydrogenase
MTSPRINNWFGNLTSQPRMVAHPREVDELVAILRDGQRYPSPVRAVGSLHSTTECGMAEGGTVVVMRGMNRILAIGPDTVTAQAGALYINVAKKLQKHGLQFYVNVELGNITIGSAASGGTKDASMPGELGQVCSYAIGMKMVTPAGEIVEVTEEQPELLHVMRSSFGLFGIIYEVTFRVRSLPAMTVYHRRYNLDKFTRELPALWAKDESMMMYIGPFLDAIVVEYRKYHGDAPPRHASSWQWRFRNYAWETVAPFVSYLITRLAPGRRLRHAVLDAFYQLINLTLVKIIRGRNTIATDQQIRYPAQATNSRYTFSIWAFPEERYAATLRDYFAFARDYYRRHGYRPNMTHVGYRIARDTSAPFSYSYAGNVMTIDPVSTGDLGWEEFLLAYNRFCSERDGVPLFNQTWGLTRAQVERAFGERLELVRSYRKRFDPTGRLLNRYFAELIG